jgi:iron-sulfur cluster repair protein YtfE (RIC family)
MSAISATLTEYHRCCDRLFADLADPIAREDWDGAEGALRHCRAAIERLVRMEEEVLFPAYERQTGKDQGPTRVLRFDHAQIGLLFGQLEAALQGHDAPASGVLRSRLSVALREHWAREEGLMFPLADEVLAGEAGRLAEALRCIGIE